MSLSRLVAFSAFMYEYFTSRSMPTIKSCLYCKLFNVLHTFVYYIEGGSKKLEQTKTWGWAKFKLIFRRDQKIGRPALKLVQPPPQGFFLTL